MPEFNKTQKTFLYLSVTAVATTILYLIFPGLFSFIFNIIRALFILLIIIFLFSTFLVFIGFRKQAKRLLTEVIDGSLSMIDIIHELKKTSAKITEYLHNLFIILLPFYAFLANLIIYLGLIFVFKYIGKEYNLALTTIILSAGLILLVAYINRPHRTKSKDPVTIRFKKYFDGLLEISIFAFFLTMDNTNLFFLPDYLNTELHASIGNYDLMLRGINFSSGAATTLNIIMLTLFIEIIRNTIGVIVVARKHYNRLEASYQGGEPILKTALKQGLHDNLDDLLKFTTYITFLILVFLLFPRLKLLAMLSASLAGLVADIIIPSRIKQQKHNDLVGRLLARLFRY